MAVERSASDGYNKLLLQKQGSYMVISVDDTTLQILRDELKTRFLSTGQF